MTEQEAIDILGDLPKRDVEMAHTRADDTLVAFLRSNGFNKIADAYEQAKDDVGFFYA